MFDDGKHRVELLHLGVAHTHGDALAWRPAEKILFTGDVCVNGPYNYMGDRFPSQVGKVYEELTGPMRPTIGEALPAATERPPGGRP